MNENLGLVIIHTLFLREHNRIASRLSTINPQWTDEETFEETRKIVGAQLQHITYNEFLVAVLGEEIIRNPKYSLQLKTEGFFDGYDMKINPTVENAVANAVFEFFLWKSWLGILAFTTLKMHVWPLFLPRGFQP